MSSQTSAFTFASVRCSLVSSNTRLSMSFGKMSGLSPKVMAFSGVAVGTVVPVGVRVGIVVCVGCGPGVAVWQKRCSFPAPFNTSSTCPQVNAVAVTVGVSDGVGVADGMSVADGVNLGRRVRVAVG